MGYRLTYTFTLVGMGIHYYFDETNTTRAKATKIALSSAVEWLNEHSFPGIFTLYQDKYKVCDLSPDGEFSSWRSGGAWKPIAQFKDNYLN